MNILIKETGELRSLSFIDWHDGQEYTEQSELLMRFDLKSQFIF